MVFPLKPPFSRDDFEVQRSLLQRQGAAIRFPGPLATSVAASGHGQGSMVEGFDGLWSSFPVREA